MDFEARKSCNLSVHKKPIKVLFNFSNFFKNSGIKKWSKMTPCPVWLPFSRLLSGEVASKFMPNQQVQITSNRLHEG